MLLPPLPPTFEAALRDVTAKTRDARIAAAERLAQAELEQFEAASAGLCTLSADKDPTVRSAAVRALGRIELQADAHAEHSSGERSAQADAITKASRALIDRLEDSDGRVREQAAVALGEIGAVRDHPRHQAIQRALERGLESPHPEVRFQALAGYVETAAAPEIAKVSKLLRDADVEVRGQAARALGEFSPAQASAPLRAALEDSALRVRSEAALALAKLGDDAGSDAIGRALDDVALRHEALEAIGALKLTAHTERVAAMARWVLGSSLDRLAAARALARLSDPRGIAALRAALHGYRRTPRVLALQIAIDLRAPELGEDLARLGKRILAADRELWFEALVSVAPESPAAMAALTELSKKTPPA